MCSCDAECEAVTVYVCLWPHVLYVSRPLTSYTLISLRISSSLWWTEEHAVQCSEAEPCVSLLCEAFVLSNSDRVHTCPPAINIHAHNGPPQWLFWRPLSLWKDVSISSHRLEEIVKNIIKHRTRCTCSFVTTGTITGSFPWWRLCFAWARRSWRLFETPHANVISVWLDMTSQRFSHSEVTDGVNLKCCNSW